MMLKQMVRLLALTLGLVGVFVCLAGIYGVWWLGSRLEQVNDRAFAAFDNGMALAQSRVRGIQERARDAKVDTGQVGQLLREWLTSKVPDRAATQLELERRAEQLAGHLEKADLWIEAVTEAILGVQQMLGLAHSIGSEIDPAVLDEVLEGLRSIRTRVGETARTVERIRELMASKIAESEASRLTRIKQLLAVALVTVGEIDSQLEALIARLSEVRSNAEQLRVRTNNHIFWATMGGYFILGWIAAGQLALCVWSWNSRCLAATDRN